MSGAILLLAYSRAEILRETVQALRNSDKTGIQELVVVLQGTDLDVNGVIEGIDWIKKKIIRTSYPKEVSSKEAINRNLYQGLTEIFNDSQYDFAAVIEDDICESEDFFLFVNAVYNENRSDKYFRAINGFSGIPREESKASNYGKYRFGVGWGWALPRNTWIELMGTWHGSENKHWDGLIEPFIKTGFTVAPGMSRIRNIGFGEGATHTNSKRDPSVLVTQQKIAASFIGSPIHLMHENQYTYTSDELNWREDCRVFIYPSNARGRLIHSIYLLTNTLLSTFPDMGPLSNRVLQKISSVLNRIVVELG